MLFMSMYVYIFFVFPTGKPNIFALTIFLSMETAKCGSCRKFRPFSGWDEHELCPRCRECSDGNRCTVCTDWVVSRWDSIAAWKEEKAATEKEREGKKSVGNSTGKKPARKPASQKPAPRKNSGKRRWPVGKKTQKTQALRYLNLQVRIPGMPSQAS